MKPEALPPESRADLLRQAGDALAEDWTSFGMANIGTRPTFGSGELRLEAHLFEPPEGGLYGQQVRIRFHSRLRDEQKFEDAQALHDQLQTDRKESLQWVKQYREGNPIHATVE